MSVGPSAIPLELLRLQLLSDCVLDMRGTCFGTRYQLHSFMGDIAPLMKSKLANYFLPTYPISAFIDFAIMIKVNGFNLGLGIDRVRLRLIGPKVI